MVLNWFYVRQKGIREGEDEKKHANEWKMYIFIEGLLSVGYACTRRMDERNTNEIKKLKVESKTKFKCEVEIFLSNFFQTKGKDRNVHHQKAPKWRLHKFSQHSNVIM